MKPNGDWLALRYNDTEHNVVLWEFHNGIRRPLIRPRDGDLLKAEGDREKWHELKLDVDGANITGSLDGANVLVVRARQRAGAGTQQRAAESGSVPGEQPGASAAGRRQGRPLVEDRQHQLFQGLRGEPNSR